MKRINHYIICFLFCTVFACQSEIDKFDVESFSAPGEFQDALLLVQDLKVEHTLSNDT